MPGEGWIKLFRRIQSHKLWNSSRFSPGQAWVDLLLSASHRGEEVIVSDKVIKVERGDVFTSQLALGKRWRWDRRTVRRFLVGLEKVQMCAIKRSIRGPIGHTVITILNYDSYQQRDNTRAHLEEHLEEQLVPNWSPFSPHTQEGKNEKNVKKKRRGKRRKAPAVKNPYPFTIYWNTKEQRLRVDDAGVIVEHFTEWAKRNDKGSVPIRELLREKQPSFERHAIEKGYTNVSPGKLTLLFCRWIESDILKYRGNRSQKSEDAFDEAIRKAEEEEGE